MRPIMLFQQVRTATLYRLEPTNELDGYILQQPSEPTPPGRGKAWGYLVYVTGTFVGLRSGTSALSKLRQDDVSSKLVPLQPVVDLVPPTVRKLRPVRSGRSYRIVSPPVRGLATPELAEALETIFERFARERSFTPEKPLEIFLSRGFKVGSPGHGEGHAADIAAVGGKNLLIWKQEWDRAMTAAEKITDPQHQAEAIAAEQKRNLGYGLYKALQAYSGWRVNQGGWRPYRGAMQLFGPWTAAEGPWKAMQIKDSGSERDQLLRDQQWVFQAHQDHIHVAR